MFKIIFLLSFLSPLITFASVNMGSLQDQDQSTFIGHDSKTNKPCQLTYHQGEYTFATTSYLPKVEFVLSEVFGGSRRGRTVICEKKYSFCFYGNPINSSTGDVDENIDFNIEGAFSPSGKPVFLKLVNSKFNSSLDKTCYFN